MLKGTLNFNHLLPVNRVEQTSHSVYALKSFLAIQVFYMSWQQRSHECPTYSHASNTSPRTSRSFDSLYLHCFPWGISLVIKAGWPLNSRLKMHCNPQPVSWELAINTPALHPHRGWLHDTRSKLTPRVPPEELSLSSPWQSQCDKYPSFPPPLLLIPEITSQVNCSPSKPCLRV